MVRIACVQLNSGPDLDANLAATAAWIRAARAAGAELIATPENTGWMVQGRPKALARARVESEHPGVAFFSDLARETGAWLLIGSLGIRLDDERIANRSLLFDPDGRIANRYDKIHMFDVSLPGGESYCESATFKPGETAIVADTPWGGLGMTICYDLRFSALFRALAQGGARLLAVPAAFTVPTGRAHWHVLLRARAIENGCFVIAPAQCGVHDGGRHTYGHSLMIDPWGEVIAEAGDMPGFIIADLNLARCDEVRDMVPSLRHDRVFTPPATIAKGPGGGAP